MYSERRSRSGQPGWDLVDDVLGAVERLSRSYPKIDREHILFDCMSSQLSLSVCIEQFLLHMTFPLLVPLFIKRYGLVFLYTQRFTAIQHYIYSAVFYTMIIAIVLSPEQIGLQYIFPAMVYLMHRFMVALKYGTLSPSEYRKMMFGNSDGVRQNGWPTAETIAVVNGYQNQLQLLSGWLSITPELVEYEMLTSAGRVGINVHEYAFQVASPDSGRSEEIQYKRWQRLLSVPEGPVRGLMRNADGSYSVSVHDACLSLMRDSDPAFIRRVISALILCICLLNAAMPLVVENSQLSKMSNWALVYHVSAFFINFGYSYAALSFVLTAFVDTYRRFKCAEALESLVRVADVDRNVKLRVAADLTSHSHSTEVYTVNKLLERSNTFKVDISGESIVEMRPSHTATTFERNTPAACDDADVYSPECNNSITKDYSEALPKLNMKCASNYIAWAVCRSQLHAFGSRIRFRLDVNNGRLKVIASQIFVVLYLTLVDTGVILLLSLLLVVSLSVAFINDTRILEEANTPFLHAVIWVYMFAFSEAGIIFAGHLVNVFMTRHR